MDIIDKIPIGVLLLDEEGTIVKLNIIEEISSDILSERFVDRSIFDVLKIGNNNLAEQFKEKFAKKEAFKIPSFKIKDFYLSFEFRSLSSGGGILTIKDVTEVAKLQQQLKEYSKQLEKKVEERTKELAAANRELQAQQEELIKANIKLKELDRLKGEFLANMSHELRTLLNAIILLSDLLAKNKNNNLTQDDIKKAQTIHTPGKDLLRLINGILDLSKVESGKMDIEMIEFNSTYLVQEISDLFSDMISEKNLDFIIKDNLKQNIISDKHKISQMVKNLISNAIKFTKEGFIKVSIDKYNQDKFLIIVQDSGIGIPKEKHQKIFEEFTQADGSI